MLPIFSFPTLYRQGGVLALLACSAFALGINVGGTSTSFAQRPQPPIVRKPADTAQSNDDSQQQVPPISQELASLRMLETSVQKIILQSTPSVVSIDGLGTGVIVSAEGLVLTVSHVAGASGRKVEVIFPDGQKVIGTTLGSNPNLDTGAIQLPAGQRYPFLKLSERPNFKPGQWCVAMGYPYSFSPGNPAVARLGRVLGRDISGKLLTDCSMMGGDSGGPVIDTRGEIIAINSSVKLGINENLHVPVTDYWDRELRRRRGITSGKRASVYLGISAKTIGTEVHIRKVRDDSPLAPVGVRSGDIIVGMDQQPITSFQQVIAGLKKRKPGDELLVTIRRSGQTIPIKIELAAKPTQPRSATVKAMPTEIAKTAAEIAAESNVSIVQILSNRQTQPKTPKSVGQTSRCSVLGTVIAPGWVITKHSELPNGGTCKIADGRAANYVIAAVDTQKDLCLLKVPKFVTTRSGINLDASAIELENGTLVVSLDSRQQVAAYGIVSRSGYNLTTPERSADSKRSGIEFNLTDEIPNAPSVDQGPQENSFDRWGGGPFSTRRADFGPVIVHDGVLANSKCGGPLMDLQGNLVGINIARTTRMATLAISIADVLEFAGPVIRQDMANRQ